MAQSEKVECFNKQQNIFDDLSDFYADDNEFEQIDLDKDVLRSPDILLIRTFTIELESI